MSSPCFLLTTLPAELRNTIYDLVAAAATLDIFIQDEAIQAVPLSASLTRTCRQLREESLPIYLDNARKTSSFMIHNRNLENSYPSLTFLHSIADLQPGTNLRIRFVLHIDDVDTTLQNLDDFVLGAGQEYEWIVENGCSLDIANSLDFAFDFQPLSPRPLTEPKGHPKSGECSVATRIENLRDEMCRQNFCRRVQVQLVSERLAFQKIHHAFVRDTRAVEGETESGCNLCWHRMDGGLCFV